VIIYIARFVCQQLRDLLFRLHDRIVCGRKQPSDGARDAFIPSHVFRTEIRYVKSLHDRNVSAYGDVLRPLKRKSISLIGCVFSVPLITACYPHPHEYISRQEFSGVLLKDGSPVSDTIVLVGHFGKDSGEHCADASAVTVTDAAGRFYIASSVQKRLFTSLINPPSLV
jgi:hypothetical protein